MTSPRHVYGCSLSSPASVTVVVKIETVGKRHTRLEIVQCQFPYLVIVEPIVLECLDVILLGLLLTVQ